MEIRNNWDQFFLEKTIQKNTNSKQVYLFVYLKKDMNMIVRIIMFLGGVCMFTPSMAASAVGIVICVVSYIMAGGFAKKAEAA